MSDHTQISRSRKNSATVSAMALAILLLIVLSGPIYSGKSKAAVSLLYFRAEEDGQAILLQWATATEFDTAYFYLERANTVNGDYQMLDQIGYVASEAPPDGLSGAEYERRDEDGLSPDGTYWYILVEVERGQGNENRTDPISITLNDSDVTPTSSPTPTATKQQPLTSTREATATVPSPSSPTPVSGQATAAATLSATVTPAQPAAGLVSTPIGDGLNAPLSDSGEASSSGGGSSSPQSAEAAAPGSTAYPPPQSVTPESMLEAISTSYPAPPTPAVSSTLILPEFSEPIIATEGTTFPNIGSGRAGPGDGMEEEVPEISTSPALGTLFLWIGFGAALVFFVSAVLGAIYFFGRNRSADR